MKTSTEVRSILMDIMESSCDGLAVHIITDYDNFDIKTGYARSTELSDYEMIDMILDSYCEDCVFWDHGLTPDDLRPIFEKFYHPTNGSYNGIMGMTSIDTNYNCTYKSIDEIMTDFIDSFNFWNERFKK